MMKCLNVSLEGRRWHLEVVYNRWNGQICDTLSQKKLSQYRHALHVFLAELVRDLDRRSHFTDHISLQYVASGHSIIIKLSSPKQVTEEILIGFGAKPNVVFYSFDLHFKLKHFVV